jgi:hypothetical protein
MILPYNVADYAKEPQANGPVEKPARVLYRGMREGVWNLKFEICGLWFELFLSEGAVVLLGPTHPRPAGWPA